MKKELLKNGVDIRTHCLVEKVHLEGKSVKGVQINGQNISCRSVLSNSNILSTIHKLVGDENFSPAFIKEVNKVRLNDSSCQVYIGIKKGETIDNVGDLLFTSVADEYNTEKILSKQVSSRTFSFYYPEIRPGSDSFSIVSSTNARFKDWANLSDEQYKIAKKNLIEDTLDALEKYVPDIRKKADYFEAATPRTFKRYTLVPDRYLLRHKI